MKSHYILRAIFRKYKKCIKQDKHFKDLSKSGKLNTFYPTFESLYRLIIMKKRERVSLDRIHGVGAGMSIFDKMSEKISKSVLEDFFKDEGCRKLFKRYYSQIYKSGYSPCEQRAYTRVARRETDSDDS